MEAVILAGGFGTRLRELVPDRPKPMAPVGGRPFLELLLDNLANNGFEHIVLSVGFMAEKIRSHFGTTYGGLAISYVFERHPLGTGGATRLAMCECANSHVYVLNGDTYLDLEVPSVEALWQQDRRPVLVAKRVHDTARYGRLLVADGRVTGFSEKGVAGSGLINAGVYVLNAGQLDSFKDGQAFSLELDYLSSAVRNEVFDVFVTHGRFIDIGVPEDYTLAQTLLLGGTK